MDAIAILQRLGNGHLLEDIARAIIDISEQVVTAEKPGSVTIALKVAHVPDTPAVTVTEQVKIGWPVAKARSAIFYSVGDGDLHLSDPRQLPLNFRVVEEEASEVREAK